MKCIMGVFVLIVSITTSAIYADNLPAGLMLIGYDGEAWYPYITADDQKTVTPITSLKNPAHATWLESDQRFFIKNTDGTLSTFDIQENAYKEITNNDKNYTQLRASKAGVSMIELKNGKSQSTSLMILDKDYQPHGIHEQFSAQFHPLLTDKALYYSHVSCRQNCKPLVQDVWKKNKTTGLANQITMLNATTYLHSVDADENFAYLSSNQSGHYHLARINLHTQAIEWLTSGQVTDSFPSVSADDRLYFIRRDANGSKLAMLDLASLNDDTSLNTITFIELPKNIQKIRYVEISQ